MDNQRTTQEIILGTTSMFRIPLQTNQFKRVTKSEPEERSEFIKKEFQLFIQQEKSSVDSEESVIHYCRGELLGHGAYGKVYQGLDTSTG
jgi:hypothetical protein